MRVVLTAFAVGLIIGWVASVLTSTDQVRYIMVAIAGSFIAEVVLENVAYPVSPPFIAQVISNAAGAIILIVAARIYLHFQSPSERR